jgi:hypothetical protein
VGNSQPNRTTAQAPASSAFFKAQYTTTAASYHVAGAPLGFGETRATLPDFSAAPLADANALQVRVLFIYNNVALQAAGTADQIDGYSKGCLEQGNVVLAQSGVSNFQWQFVGSALAPDFTVPNDKNLDYNLAQISPGGAIGDWVSSQANKSGAAQVFFWGSVPTQTGVTYSGIANSIEQQPITNARAIGGWGPGVKSSYKTVIHELSHNFGCEHDRANVGAGGTGFTAPDGNGKWC